MTNRLQFISNRLRGEFVLQDKFHSKCNCGNPATMYEITFGGFCTPRCYRKFIREFNEWCEREANYQTGVAIWPDGTTIILSDVQDLDIAIMEYGLSDDYAIISTAEAINTGILTREELGLMPL